MNTESPRPEAGLKLAKAASLHRDCGNGLPVDWQRELLSEFRPASSFLLGAGFSRECVEKRILRCAQDDKSWVARSKGASLLPAIPDAQVSQVNK